MITNDEIFIMSILEKVTLASNKQLTILAGKKEISTMRKALKKLIDKGLIITIRMGDHMVYTLSSGGLMEVEKTRKPYVVKGSGSEHIETVTSAACWLYAKTGCSIQDLYFQREMTRFKLGHAPDIMIGRNCVECELNAKTKTKLESNFRCNSESFYQQIWFVPERLPSLQQHLRDFAQKYNCKLLLKTLDDMNKDIDDFDIKQNSPRVGFVKGEPSPHTKERTVTLHD